MTELILDPTGSRSAHWDALRRTVRIPLCLRLRIICWATVRPRSSWKLSSYSGPLSPARPGNARSDCRPGSLHRRTQAHGLVVEAQPCSSRSSRTKATTVRRWRTGSSGTRSNSGGNALAGGGGAPYPNRLRQGQAPCLHGRRDKICVDVAHLVAHMADSPLLSSQEAHRVAHSLASGGSEIVIIHSC